MQCKIENKVILYIDAAECTKGVGGSDIKLP